jgi:hypothetical protein
VLYSAATSVTMLAAMALAGAGFGQSPRFVDFGGLFQRASIVTGFAWLTAVSARTLRRVPASAAPEALQRGGLSPARLRTSVRGHRKR